MAELKCPVGMVPIKSWKLPHPEIKAFCINKTEVAEATYNPQTVFGSVPTQGVHDVDSFVMAIKLFFKSPSKKPVTDVSWYDAEAYCQRTYSGGHLPDNKQWEQACGGREYCTASGLLKHSEAIFHVDGPADVGSTPDNWNGVKDMTGNVWEWTRSDDGKGQKYVRGGSWDNPLWGGYLRADNRAYFRPEESDYRVGIRCVAPVM